MTTKTKTTRQKPAKSAQPMPAIASVPAQAVAQICAATEPKVDLVVQRQSNPDLFDALRYCETGSENDLRRAMRVIRGALRNWEHCQAIDARIACGQQSEVVAEGLPSIPVLIVTDDENKTAPTGLAVDETGAQFKTLLPRDVQHLESAKLRKIPRVRLCSDEANRSWVESSDGLAHRYEFPDVKPKAKRVARKRDDAPQFKILPSRFDLLTETERDAEQTAAIQLDGARVMAAKSTIEARRNPFAQRLAESVALGRLTLKVARRHWRNAKRSAAERGLIRVPVSYGRKGAKLRQFRVAVAVKRDSIRFESMTRTAKARSRTFAQFERDKREWKRIPALRFSWWHRMTDAAKKVIRDRAAKFCERWLATGSYIDRVTGETIQSEARATETVPVVIDGKEEYRLPKIDVESASFRGYADYLARSFARQCGLPGYLLRQEVLKSTARIVTSKKSETVWAIAFGRRLYRKPKLTVTSETVTSELRLLGDYRQTVYHTAVCRFLAALRGDAPFGFAPVKQVARQFENALSIDRVRQETARKLGLPKSDWIPADWQRMTRLEALIATDAAQVDQIDVSALLAGDALTIEQKRLIAALLAAGGIPAELCRNDPARDKGAVSVMLKRIRETLGRLSICREQIGKAFAGRAVRQSRETILRNVSRGELWGTDRLRPTENGFERFEQPRAIVCDV